MSIFKSCDIRGIYGADLTEDTAYRLGRAVGARLSGERVVVGGDLRPSTPALVEALCEGLVRSAAHVVELGLLPTPAFYYGKRLLEARGGVMVTASHNPPQYNGFKLMLGDLPITPEELQALAREMEAGGFVEGQGSRREADVLEQYIESIASAFGDLGPHRVVVDAGDGSMSTVAPQALRRCGQQVHALYCTPDGAFPHRDPNPAVPEHLGALRREVVSVGAELGAAYDGDGDRVILVDDRGRVQPADRLLVLFIRHVLAARPGEAVVYDLKCSSIVEEEIRAAGGRPLRERSGHAFIKRRLLLEGAALGGEISGHYFYAELGGDDTLYATLLLLRVLEGCGQSLSQAMDTVPAYPITPDIRLPCPPERAARILDELARAFADHEVDTLDGVRVAFTRERDGLDGWALARLSVTEPLITLRFEAHSESELAELQARVRGASRTLEEVMANSLAGSYRAE